MNALSAAASMRRAIEQLDHVRMSPARVGGPVGHKEWLHFSVCSGELDVVVNFSLVDQVYGLNEARSLPRLTVMVRTPEGWSGDVRTYAPEAAEAGAGDRGLRFGQEVVHFEDGVYRLSARVRRGDVEVHLVLEPETFPSVVHNVELGDPQPLHWLIVPRLRASGEVRVGQRTWQVRGAPAYHDHNWGGFRFGGDWSWEWAYGLPDDPANPWSVVLVRMSDRAGHRVRNQGVFLWRGPRQERVFRGSSVRVDRSGVLRVSSMFQVPPVLGLVRPGTASGVPAELRAETKEGADHVRVVVRPRDVARVLVPHDVGEGFTAIHESPSAIEVVGEIGGESVCFQGQGMLEVLHG